VESLRESAWPKEADLQGWNNRIVKQEEKIVVARRYAVIMLEMAEEAGGYDEKMDSLLKAEKVVEVAPDVWIMWGIAVHHVRCEAEENKAMAGIA